VKFLFCATDAGGARNLAPVAELANSSHDVNFLTSLVTERLLGNQRFPTQQFAFGNSTSARAYLDSQPFDAILVGTTGRPSAEAWLTIAARGRIPTIAVLDEWYNYRMRFAEGCTLPYLPDLICCQDALAFAEAKAEGLNEARLRITGSPALSALVDTIEQMVSTPPPLPALFAELPRPIFVFLSETHSADYGRRTGETGRIGPYIGYDENTVRNLIAERLRATDTVASVIERLHPASQSEYQLLECGPKISWRIDRGPPALWPVLWHADAVIGMRSMALLEAALMGHSPAALQPGLIGPDLCTAARLGLAQRLDGKESLDPWIAGVLARRQATPRQPRRPIFAARQSAAQVLTLAEHVGTAFS
jgi:hypothetical protein